MKSQKSVLLVLNYHHVTKHAEQKSLYDVSLAQLIEQFTIIKEEGSNVLSLSDADTYAATDAFKLAITFDDGNASDYDLVLPTLNDFGFTAGFFVLSSYLNKPGRLTTAQLKELSTAGYMVGSHGVSHEILTKANQDIQKFEFEKSKADIEQIISKPVNAFAFPYGQSNDLLHKTAQASGYEKLFTTGMRTNILNQQAEIYYRWNITCKTDIQLIRNVISSKGKISPASELQNRLHKNAVK